MTKKEIINKVNKVLEKYPAQTRTKHEQIFFDKIKEYNEIKAFYIHCIKIDNNVMIIRPDKGCWEFDVYPLEEIK